MARPRAHTAGRLLTANFPTIAIARSGNIHLVRQWLLSLESAALLEELHRDPFVSAEVTQSSDIAWA